MSSVYQLIDAGNFKKLEKFGPYLISRPSAQAVWRPSLPQSEWKKADALFTRNSGGDGKWTKFNRKLPEHWDLDVDGIKMRIRLTDFGHTGIFPEHHQLPILARNIEKKVSQGKEFKLLNLFAYTGAVSLVGAHAGAHVTHIDASKTSVAWARENADISNLGDKPIRWIVEDVQKFVQREVKRGNKYHGIVLDPPSFGRGPKGDVWKIEEHLFELLDNLKQILDEDYSFIQLSAHSQGYTPIALENLLSEIVDAKTGKFTSFEMCMDPQNGDKRLPVGACALFERG